jgi:hypothetical protein
MIWVDPARLRIRVPSEPAASAGGHALTNDAPSTYGFPLEADGPPGSGFAPIHAIVPQTKRTAPGRTAMARRREFCSVFAAIGILGCVVAHPGPLSAQNAVAIDADDIGGVVTGPSGPEAGVWVIAETTDLPTKFARMVVTDEQGRYVVPDLPKATYRVWVRGYGRRLAQHDGRARQAARSPGGAGTQ